MQSHGVFLSISLEICLSRLHWVSIKRRPESTNRKNTRRRREGSIDGHGVRAQGVLVWFEYQQR